MHKTDIQTLRLAHLGISDVMSDTPQQVVARLGAMQAQDYAGVLWSVGLRLQGATVADIEGAIAEKHIIRTWPMRGTLHLVAAEDVHWMLQLLTPRVVSQTASRRKSLELDESTLQKSYAVIEKLLVEHTVSTRDEILHALENNNILTTGQRGYHILFQAAMDGLICFGPRKDKQYTFVLLDEWVPQKITLDKDAALEKLTHTYFASHGPATIRDYMGWAGLLATDAKRGLEMNQTKLIQHTLDGTTYYMHESNALQQPESVYLLPGFDEYMLGYKERAHILSVEQFQRVVPGANGMFMSTIVSGGRMMGLWKKMIKKNRVIISREMFRPFSEREEKMFVEAVQRYARFLGVEVG